MNTKLTDAWSAGYDAYHAGKTMNSASDKWCSVNDICDDWRKGWLYAREEMRIGYKLGQSLRAAGLTNE